MAIVCRGIKYLLFVIHAQEASLDFRMTGAGQFITKSHRFFSFNVFLPLDVAEIPSGIGSF